MCGRYSVAVAGTALVDALDGVEPGFEWSLAYSVAPRTRPVSRAVNNVRTLDRHDRSLIDPIADGDSAH